jgi:hypothetical protein
MIRKKIGPKEAEIFSAHLSIAAEIERENCLKSISAIPIFHWEWGRRFSLGNNPMLQVRKNLYQVVGFPPLACLLYTGKLNGTQPKKRDRKNWP